MGQIICRGCGRRIDDLNGDLQFCPYCGTVPKKENICLSCGKQIDSMNGELRFCPYCGNSPASAPNSTFKKPKKNKKWLVFGIILPIILITLSISLLLFFNDTEDNPTTAENMQQQKYDQAIKLMNNENFDEAYKLFAELDGFKDSAEKMEKIRASSLKYCNIGDYITFGTYEQDNDVSNGPEEIEWRVLDKKDGQLLIISKYSLDAREFVEEYIPDQFMRWDTSDLRVWLNNDFYKTAFSPKEQACIMYTELATVSSYGKEADIFTTDKVFLLSADEATTYFESDEDRYTTATEYAISHSIFDWNENNPNFPVLKEFPAWQLRSSGETYYAAIVDEYGSVNADGNCYIGGKHGVRPVMWIEFD